MKMIPSILVIIIILAIVGIALYYSKTKSSNISELALWIQAIATVVLVLITGFYAIETRRSRISQEEGFNKYVKAMEKATETQKKGFDKYVDGLEESRISQQEGVKQYIKELQESRKQEVRPNVYALFYWNSNTSKYYLIIKNIGVGPAFNIKTTYSVITNEGKTIKDVNVCKMLGVEKEKVKNTQFSSEDRKMKNAVNIKISYQDAFGQTFEDSIQHSLGQLFNDPIPVDFDGHRREIAYEFRTSDIRQWLQVYFETFEKLQKDVKEIKESIKNP